MTHYATEHRWWASVDPADDDPDLFHNLPGNQPPEIIHTHDPSDESLLVSIVTPEQRETMLQNRAEDEPRRQALINSLDAAEPDTDATIFGELMDPSRVRERRRACLLCPGGWKQASCGPPSGMFDPLVR